MSFGGAVKLTGESEYRRALSQITQNLREVSSQMKLVSTSFDANDRSVTALTAQEDVLNRKLSEQTNKLNVLKSQYAAMSSSYQEQTNRHNALVNSYNQEKSKLDEIGRTLGTTSNEYQTQKQKVEELAVQVQKSTQAQDANEKSMSKMRTEINNAQSDCNKTANEIKNLGQQAEESGEKAEKGSEGYTTYKNVLANLASSAITAAVNGLKKLSDAIVDCGKQAINNYASYEQLVGGVETIFKDSAGEVLQYANNAYATAGMSANEYMEQVTGFSATLLQGLEGDTKRAAEVADVAVRDMSDNANKMGTDMVMITNAYQGFAKQNYTMLDNLKLGYGGTASEMARLINDSGVLGDTVEVTAKTVKDVPFDQMIYAIHQIQQELGFTGTTAAEAAGTIEGSTKAMQAAWQNLLTGMADETADLDDLIGKFTSNLVTNFSNTLPRVKQVVKGMSKTFEGLADAFASLSDEIAETLTDIVTEIIKAAPTFIKAMMTVVSSVVKHLVKALPEIIETVGDALIEIVQLIPEFITNIVTKLANGLPKITEAITTVFMNLLTTIPSILAQLAQAVPEMLMSIQTGLENSARAMGEVIGEFFGIESKSRKAAEAIEVTNEAIRNSRDALEELEPKIADYNELLSSHGNTVSELDDKINEAESNITAIYKEALSEQRGLRDEDIISIQEYLQKIQDLQEEKLSILTGNQLAELKKVQLEAGTITEETAAQYVSNLGQAYEDAKAVQDDYYTSRLTILQNRLELEEGYTEAQYKEETEEEALRNAQKLELIKKYYTDGLALVGEKSAEWVSTEKSQWQQLGDIITNGTQQQAEGLNWNYQTYQLWQQKYNEACDNWKVALSEMDTQTANSFLNMATVVKAGGGEITGDMKSSAEAILGAYDNLPTNLEEIGKSSLEGMTYGLSENIPTLSDTSEMSAQEIVDAIREYLDINSPSKVMEQIGTYVVQGLEQGMKTENGNLVTLSNTLAQTIVKAFTANSANMQSVGRNIATQIAQGINGNAQTVFSRAQQVLQGILKTFSNAAAQYSKIGKTIVEYIANAMKSSVSTLSSAALSIMNAALKQINSVTFNFKNAGMNMAQGVAQGFLSQEWYVRSVMNAMMDRVVADVRARMKINSPSKVFAEIGDYMAQGLGVGFTDEMKGVTKDIQASIPQTVGAVSSKGATAAIASGNTYDMVSAFKQALSEMKIELDDEVAGQFVDKTVTKLIYS